jgi:hypothetical protein
MRAYLKRRKLLFKIKTQPANNSSGQEGDDQHSTKVDGRMHNGEAKIADLVGEHLQIKEKN